MRTVATLAAILALPCGLFADDSQVPAIDLTIAPPAACATDAPATATTASGKYDTSVYHLKHAHARQIIPAVRQALCKSFAAEAADHSGSRSVVSVVFMPTSSDDALVAICPREQADRVKQAIESCDVEKHYAVKLQLFEISPTGEAVAVGDPAVIVGREGVVQCKTSTSGPVTLKLQVSDTPSGVTAPANAAAANETSEEPYCCGPTCGQTEMEAEAPAETSVCPTSCTTHPTCQATCPALTSACPVTSSVNGTACNGTCHSGHGECGSVCTGESAACKAKCGSACKCESAGTCNCGSSESSSTELSDACEKSPATSSFAQSLTPEENQVLIRVLLHSWMLEHQEHSGGIARDVAAPAATGESCSKCDSSAAKESPTDSATSAEAPADKTGVELGSPAPAASAAEVPATTQMTTPYDPAPVPSLEVDAVTGGLFVQSAHTNDDGFHLSGVYRLGKCEQDDVAVTRVSDSDSCDSTSCPSISSEGSSAQITCTGECSGNCSEPPALLTLSARKDAGPNLNIIVSPRWQAELAKIYQGRRLSEIFEPRNCQDPGAAALGRLLVEIPKPAPDAYSESSAHHGVIVVDLPDRIRVFESAAGAAPATAASCSDCRDQFRAFLEQVFRGTNGLEEITQAGHVQETLGVSDAGRELPNVTHSKLDTTVVTYPLRDLVLLDNADRPVFDTCTIIDHIQSAVAPETWGHPSVSIQLDQQSMSLVIRQTPEVHKKIETHLRELRRQQVKQLTGLIERLSTDSEPSDD